MRLRRAVILVMLAGAAETRAQTWKFDDQKAGSPPGGMTCALSGRGNPGRWVLQEDASAPSRPLVLAQTEADSTSYRFPHCLVDGLTARDLTLSVRFKPVSGSRDQAAGLIWRYRDPDHYYVVRANALEGNVVAYKMDKGRRLDLPLKGEGRTYGKKAEVPSGAWSELKVAAKGNLFEVHLNGRLLYTVEDGTFPDAGKAGLWTKADSVTLFDDLKAEVSP